MQSFTCNYSKFGLEFSKMTIKVVNNSRQVIYSKPSEVTQNIYEMKRLKSKSLFVDDLPFSAT